MSFAKAQERKQKQIQAETIKSLKQQVEDLKEEIKEGKKPLRLEIERLTIRISELEKEKLHVELKLLGVQRENNGFKIEVEKLCKELTEFHKKEKADASNDLSSIKSE